MLTLLVNTNCFSLQNVYVFEMYLSAYNRVLTKFVDV